MLTLSVILLLGRNGLITKHLLGLTGFNIYGLKYKQWECFLLLIWFLLEFYSLSILS
jgi:ABC-type spermidine/putrescine transport system permease subunit I